MKATLLKPLYDRAIGGLPLMGTPADVARRFAPTGGGDAPATDRIVAFYTGLGGATGFVCGLPGFLLMPVTLPANLAGVALIQLHMSATFAYLGGHDLDDPATRDRCIRCLLEKIDAPGRNTEEEEAASRVSVKLLERGVRLVLEQTTRLAGKAARSYALRKLGARRIPLFGGILGAGSDAYVTAHVGRCARAEFLG